MAINQIKFHFSIGKNLVLFGFLTLRDAAII